MIDLSENLRSKLRLSYLNIKSEQERNLKQRAYAELILKAIYSSPNHDKWFSLKDVKKCLEDFLQIKKIPQKGIKKALNFLSEEISYVNYDDNQEKWKIKNEKELEIANNLSSYNNKLDEIVKEFAVVGIDNEILKNWFLGVCELFFSKYEEEILEIVIGNKGKGRLNGLRIDKVAKELIKNFGLGDFQEKLISNLNRFIENLSDEESEFLLLVSQSILTSKIVSMDLDVDTLFHDFLHDSKMLVDTNVFVSQALNEEKFDDLFDSLSGIGCNAFFLTQTKDEYENLIKRKKDCFSSVGGSINLDSILINDEFYDLAKRLGCANGDDYETFFNNNFLPFPPKIGSMEISELEINSINNELESLDKKGVIEKEIYSGSIRRKPKIGETLKHDVLLNNVSWVFRGKKEKIFVLTTDSTMQDYALSKMGKNDDFPVWVHIEAVFNIIAASNPYNKSFSKIFKNLLKESVCLNGVHGFNMEDIRFLAESSKDIKIGACSKIESCVEAVKKHIFEGGDNNSEEFKRKLDDIIKHEEMEEVKKITEKLAEEERVGKERIERRDEILIRGEKNKLIFIEWGKFLVLSSTSLAVAYFLFLLIKRLLNVDISINKAECVGILLPLVVVSLGVVGYLYKKLLNNIKSTPEKAKKKIEDLFKD